MNNEPNITALFWVNDIAFKEFKKAVQNEVNAIVTTYSTVFKCLGDLIEECYMREKRLNNIILLFYLSQRIHLYNFKKNIDYSSEKNFDERTFSPHSIIT